MKSAPGPDRPSRSRRQTLPRQRILRRPRDFAALRERGQRAIGRGIALTLLPMPEISGEMVGFFTPKRIGKAHDRNFVRRRMREVYRRFLAQPHQKRHLLWVARPEALGLEFEEMRTTMAKLLRKAEAMPVRPADSATSVKSIPTRGRHRTPGSEKTVKSAATSAPPLLGPSPKLDSPQDSGRVSDEPSLPPEQ